MQYVVGLDGGGTKTAVCVLSLEGKEQARAAFGAMNLNGGDEQQVIKTIQQAISWLSDNFGGLSSIVAICIGSAGVSNPRAAQLLLNTVKASGYTGKVLLKGDHETALAGAISGRDGVMLIAGTGSICVGMSQRATARAGGYGHIIDDEGSGYAIGRDILSAVVRTFDAREQQTSLRGAVLDYLKITELPQLIQFIYSPITAKKDIAALAFLLDEALLRGDTEALAIANKAATQLALLAQSVIDALQLQNGEISFLGSILQNCKPIRAQVTQILKQNYKELTFTEAEFDAAYGACLCAAKDINKE